MLTHAYQYNPWGRFKWPSAVIRLTAHFMYCLVFNLVICSFMVHNVLTEVWHHQTLQLKLKLHLLCFRPELVPVEKDSDVVLKFPECDKLSPPILQLDEVTFYYNKDQVIFKNTDVCAAMDSRICIVSRPCFLFCRKFSRRFVILRRPPFH